MRSKNIHVLTKYFHPVAAGIETNILETYSVLATKGWKITIHTIKDDYGKKNAFIDQEEYRGLKIIRYPFKSENFGYWPNIDFISFDGLICLHNFNVYYWRILFYSLWLKITGRKKFGLVLTPHGGFNPIWDIFPKSVALVKRLYTYTLGTLLVNSVVDVIRAVSDWEKREMTNKGINPERIVVITNGLEDEAFQNHDKLASEKIKKTVKDYGKYIIQVGRVYPIKNYETTIRAMSRIPKYINFVIVGPLQQDEKNKHYKSQLEELILKLGLQERVIFAGVIKGVDKFYVLKNAQMMVHMATWESFCNAVHEGLSQGLVCIVANAFALPYLIKDGVNGFLVDTHDDENLSKKINYVLKNSKGILMKEMAQKNVKKSLDESWSSVANKLDKVYLSI